MKFNVHANRWLDIYLNIDSSLYSKEENSLIIKADDYERLNEYQKTILKYAYRYYGIESEWFADVKDRVSFFIRRITFIGRYEKGINGFFNMYRILTEEGDVCIWNQWNKPKLNLVEINNGVFTCVGTVDELTTYALGEGFFEKQTKLKCCKLKAA